MKSMRLAIVGHTNTGKTSLIRNLARERNFGEVRDEASTTIDVSSVSLSDAALSFEYIDTPGLEDAMGILEILDDSKPLQSKRDELVRLEAFIEHPRYQLDFDQEIKVLKQILKSDLMVYVIDTRLPFLPKFNDELTLILQTHKPMLPILNFLQQGEYIDEWKENLKAHGIHHYLEYDTIAPPQKRRIYEQIAIMFPEQYQAMRAIIDAEEKEQIRLFERSMELLADFFINLLTYQVTFKENSAEKKVMERLASDVTELESRTIKALLALYRFNKDDVEYLALDIEQTRYDPDFLVGDQLWDFSVHFGKGATVGAGIFAGVDALAGFTTLGAATATGAILGGLTNSFKFYGNHLLNKLQSKEIFCINNEAVIALMMRMVALIGLLNGRSHAEVTPIILDDSKTVTDDKEAIGFLRNFVEHAQKFRAYPDYCTLKGESLSESRKKTVEKLGKELNMHYQYSLMQR